MFECIKNKKNKKIIIAIDSCWGPHTMDRFRVFHNKSATDLMQKSPSVESDGVDAFSQDWSKDNNRLCPPVGQIAKVLAHSRMQQASGTLIVKILVVCLFMATLKAGWRAFRRFRDRPRKILRLLQELESIRHVFFDGAPNFDTLALRMKCAAVV